MPIREDRQFKIVSPMAFRIRHIIYLIGKRFIGHRAFSFDKLRNLSKP